MSSLASGGRRITARVGGGLANVIANSSARARRVQRAYLVRERATGPTGALE